MFSLSISHSITFLTLFTEWFSNDFFYCVEPPCWRTFSVFQYGGRKIVWNSLWLSSRLIFWTESKNIYTSTFPNTEIPKMAKNHEISVYFSTNEILALCHTPPIEIQNTLVSKRRTLLSWKVANKYKFSNSYAWWG